MSSHCLICGNLIPSGNLCRECRWEMNRIRLRDDEEPIEWFESKIKKNIIDVERKENKLFQ